MTTAVQPPKKLLARWESARGAHWFNLLKEEVGETTFYSYDATGMGGTIDAATDDEALAHVQRKLWSDASTRFVDLAQPDANTTPMKLKILSP